MGREGHRGVRDEACSRLSARPSQPWPSQGPRRVRGGRVGPWRRGRCAGGRHTGTSIVDDQVRTRTTGSTGPRRSLGDDASTRRARSRRNWPSSAASSPHTTRRSATTPPPSTRMRRSSRGHRPHSPRPRRT